MKTVIPLEKVFPAQAGVIPIAPKIGSAAGSIPRASGGDPHEADRISRLIRVFPAQAGVIPCQTIHSDVPVRIPHASGG